MSSIVLLNEPCVDQNVDAIVNAANKDLMCAERILLHRCKGLRLQSRINERSQTCI